MRFTFLFTGMLIGMGFNTSVAQDYWLSKRISIVNYSGSYEIKNLLGVNRAANEAYVIYDPTVRMFIDTDAMTYGYRIGAIDMTSMEIKRETIVWYPARSIWNFKHRDEPNYWKTMMIGENIVVFQYRYDKKKAVVEYLARIIDPRTMDVTGIKSLGTVSVADWESMQRGNPRKTNFRNFADVAVSPDESKILFTFRVPHAKEGSEVITYAGVFTAQLDPVFQREILFPLAKEDFIRQENYIDNEGRVYLSGYRKYKKEVNTNNPMFFLVEQSADLPRPFELDVPHYSRDFFLVFHSGRVTLLGLYTPKGAKGSHGTYSGQLDLSAGKLTGPRIAPFEAELIREVNEGYGNDDWREKNLGIPFLSFREVMHEAGGGFMLVLESHSKQEGSSLERQPGAVAGYRDPYEKHWMRDVYLLNFNSSGERTRISRFHKIQYGYQGKEDQRIDTKNMLSARVVKRDGRYYLFYNGSLKNLEKADREEVTPYDVSGNLVHGRTIMARAIIDENGTFRGARAMDGLEPGMLLYTGFDRAAADGVFLLADHFRGQYLMLLE